MLDKSLIGRTWLNLVVGYFLISELWVIRRGNEGNVKMFYCVVTCWLDETKYLM